MIIDDMIKSAVKDKTNLLINAGLLIALIVFPYIKKGVSFETSLYIILLLSSFFVLIAFPICMAEIYAKFKNKDKTSKLFPLFFIMYLAAIILLYLQGLYFNLALMHMIPIVLFILMVCRWYLIDNKNI